MTRLDAQPDDHEPEGDEAEEPQGREWPDGPFDTIAEEAEYFEEVRREQPIGALWTHGELL